MTKPPHLRWIRLAAAVAGLAVTTWAIAGCGVPADGTTHAIDPSSVPYRLLDPSPPASSPTPPTGISVTSPQVFFVNQDAQLVANSLPMNATGIVLVSRSLLSALAAGPSEAQRAQGLASALGPGARLQLLDITDGTARISLIPSSRGPAADQLPLAVGQIVLTATSVAGVDRVELVQDGQPLEAPLPGGEQTSRPLEATDYASLLVNTTATRTQKATP